MNAKRGSPRTLAAKVVQRVVAEKYSLNQVLPEVLESAVPRDRALIQELSYGTLRWLPRLSGLTALLLHKTFKEKDRDVTAVLQVALYQLLYTQLADHAVVNEAVESSRALGKSWAAPVLNAALRRFLRERDVLLRDLDQNPVSRFACPAWLLEKLQHDWPEDWETIVNAGNERPPMWLRVNTARITRDDYARQLRDTGVESTKSDRSPVALCLGQPLNIHELPGFDEGLVSVQDVSAQLAAEVLNVEHERQRVLDVCAAPGGKTAHLLERHGSLDLVAIDLDADRLIRVTENLDRLGLAARVKAGDALEPRDWWDGQAFDRILLDAPCSATGVIRRHPDIKVLRRACDIPALAARQQDILEAVWPLLAPGGMLVYGTCSVLREENDEVMAAFTAKGADRESMVIEAEWGRAGRFGRQLLPGDGEGDGFYYARLRKTP
ncbi:MAG: 16S rRNA (cytosine(967)-C(5))-methyltransferase RsmB [Gammaproteobacteria bacterium]|nr:MAG: 16S rRNA (cytosine(967)-C(5))-methyltransferase RsmB [Gammaproteobacteria bacterium]